MKSTGVKVIYDHASDTWTVQVPAKYSGKTEGLCGLADGEISNDLWVGTYAVVSVSADAGVSANVIGTFFNHWLVNSGSSATAECLADAAETGLIAGGGNDLARTFCSNIFASETFAKLASLVDPTEYIDTCVRATSGLSLLHAGGVIASDWPGCSVFSAYAEAGARLGKCISWRKESFCAYSGCSGDGCQYQACGPSIQKTCDNFKSYESLNIAFNTEGCFCSKGKVRAVFLIHFKHSNTFNTNKH